MQSKSLESRAVIQLLLGRTGWQEPQEVQQWQGLQAALGTGQPHATRQAGNKLRGHSSAGKNLKNPDGQVQHESAVSPGSKEGLSQARLKETQNTCSQTHLKRLEKDLMVVNCNKENSSSMWGKIYSPCERSTLQDCPTGVVKRPTLHILKSPVVKSMSHLPPVNKKEATSWGALQSKSLLPEASTDRALFLQAWGNLLQYSFVKCLLKI